MKILRVTSSVSLHSHSSKLSVLWTAYAVFTVAIGISNSDYWMWTRHQLNGYLVFGEQSLVQIIRSTRIIANTRSPTTINLLWRSVLQIFLSLNPVDNDPLLALRHSFESLIAQRKHWATASFFSFRGLWPQSLRWCRYYSRNIALTQGALTTRFN